MNIVTGYPPNIEALKAKFKLSGSEIFTYGDTVYNPSGGTLSLELQAHEAVHVKQQADPATWWSRYLEDPEFRYNQELEAHRAEYRSFCSRNKDRNKRARFLNTIASRLASPLYGSIVTLRSASKAISS